MTSAAFGGEDLQDLYLTTAREGFDEAKGKDFPWLGGSSCWAWLVFFGFLGDPKGYPKPT